MSGRVLPVAQVLLIGALYFAAAKTALALALPPGYATAVWPPSGIALAALLLLGWSRWPGVWVGAALAAMRVHRQLKGLTVVIFTGSSLSQAEAQRYTAAADHFLTNPSGLDAHVAAMKRLQYHALPA